MVNTGKLAEKGLYATIIILIGGIRLLARFIVFCISFFLEDQKILAENKPFPFKSLLDLSKGDVLLFQDNQGEKVVRIYLGYHQRQDGSFLFFFDIPDTDDVIYLAPMNKTGYDLYPEVSWRVIGHKQKYTVRTEKRKKVGDIIRKHG
jgi:hypothetical protein